MRRNSTGAGGRGGGSEGNEEPKKVLAPEQEIKDLLRKRRAEKAAFVTCSELVAAAVPSCQMLANAVSIPAPRANAYKFAKGWWFFDEELHFTYITLRDHITSSFSSVFGFAKLPSLYKYIIYICQRSNTTPPPPKPPPSDNVGIVHYT